MPEPRSALSAQVCWAGIGLCLLSSAGYGSRPIFGKLAFEYGLTIERLLSLRGAGAVPLPGSRQRPAGLPQPASLPLNAAVAILGV